MIPILNPGHGGTIEGEYVTKGKRSPVWPDGSQYFEGVGNRRIVSHMKYLLNEAGVPFINLIDGSDEDVSLWRRVKISKLYEGNYIGIDIHSNAGGGKGYEAYTFTGHNKADTLATLLYSKFKVKFPGFSTRVSFTDGDIDKERSDLYMLRNTPHPWIVSENFFMDNKIECRNILMSRYGIEKIAEFHVEAIITFNKQCEDN